MERRRGTDGERMRGIDWKRDKRGKRQTGRTDGERRRGTDWERDKGRKGQTGKVTCQ